MRHSGWFWLAVFLVGGGLYYLTSCTPAALACEKAGGRYFLNGDCQKIVFLPVRTAP